MNVGKWEPIRDLLTLQDRMNRLFQDGFAQRSGQEDLQTGQWTPAVDILENAESIVLRADLPGVEQDDIDLKIEDALLVLRGQRRAPEDVPSGDVHRAERPYGSFARSFSLPTNVDQAGIRALHKNGVLEVILPKKQDSRAKAIRIDVK